MLDQRCKTLEELPLLLTVPEVAAVLGVGRQKAYDLTRSGELRSMRIGKQIRVLRDELAEYLQKNQRSTS